MATKGKQQADSLTAMRETQGQRIRRLRRERGLTQKQLAEAVGVSRASVTQWESGEIGELKSGSLLRTAEVLGTTPGYLETGREEPTLEAGPPVSEFRAAPIVGTAQLGVHGYWVEMEYPVGHGDGFVDVPTRDVNAYAVRVKGDSMAPAIRSGWIVVVEPNRQLVPGEYVLVKTKDGRSMVKELLFQRDNELSLMSVNDEHGRTTLALNEVEFVHYVGFIVPPSKIRI